ANMIDTINGTAFDAVPTWVTNWSEADLIKMEDKNGDGIIQYYNDKSEAGKAIAAANGWAGNEFTPDRDIMVLANPEIAQLPNWVIALVVAGGLAAALSTAAGLLLVISTSISHDLLKKTFRPDITDKQELMYARIAAGVAVVGAGIAGINPPGFVAQVVAFAFGLAASSFFPAILLGIFDKRTNRQGAITGMILGIVFTATYIIYFKIAKVEPNIPENWLFGISPEGIGTLGMILNMVVTLVVSRLTPAPPEDVQQLVEDIRIPKGATEAHVH
ncbi:MAG: VC_2705 family sodium/solute symporter, partial [Bacteroidota bacterium]